MPVSCCFLWSYCLSAKHAGIASPIQCTPKEASLPLGPYFRRVHGFFPFPSSVGFLCVCASLSWRIHHRSLLPIFPCRFHFCGSCFDAQAASAKVAGASCSRRGVQKRFPVFGFFQGVNSVSPIRRCLVRVRGEQDAPPTFPALPFPRHFHPSTPISNRNTFSFLNLSQTTPRQPIQHY